MTLEQLVDRNYAESDGNDFPDAADLFAADVVTRVDDGRLTEHRIYHDAAGPLARLGLVPA